MKYEKGGPPKGRLGTSQIKTTEISVPPSLSRQKIEINEYSWTRDM
jgi:hypothetical protein